MKAENKALRHELILKIGDLFSQHSEPVPDDCMCHICAKVSEVGEELMKLEEECSEKRSPNHAYQYTAEEYIELSTTMTDVEIADLWDVTVPQLRAYKSNYQLHSVKKGLTAEQKARLVAEVPARRANNELLRDIAAEYGVSANYLSKLMAQGA